MSIEENNTIAMATWNIKQGGFASYSPDVPNPEREEPIRSFINDLHIHKNITALCLTDTYRWDTYYGGEEGIADHLGYKYARFTRLEDSTGDEQLKAIGITFTTDVHIQSSKALDLDTRNGLGVVLDIGKYGLQIATVYLHHEDEEMRVKQARALLAGLEPDTPTLLVGDFNGLRSNTKDGTIQSKVGDMAVRSLAHLLPTQHPIGVAARGMNQRRVIPFIESGGFTDADKKKQPTAPAGLPIFGIDYVFYNDRVAVDQVKVLPVKKASDHRALSFRASV
jgi:endonuclease/exonuclease/phosphatase family metal-dependent hydrolase